jgi:SAM-dependent methyltransferase
LPYAVVIARQRSGTSAFAQIISKGLGLQSHGEILDPATRSPVISETEGVATWPKVKAFLQHLHEDEALHLIDIKVLSLNSVNEAFRSPSLPPRIVAMLHEHKCKIIRLHRHPMAQWVSGLLATKSGVWHQQTKGEITVEKVTVDPVALENFRVACAREDVLLADWLNGLTVLDLTYEQIFAGGGYADVIARVAAFLDRTPVTYLKAVQPGNQKIAKPSLADNIENLAEVVCHLPIHESVGPDAHPAASGIGLDVLPGDTHGRIKACAGVLDQFIQSGLLREDLFREKVVLDWECGDGAYSMAFSLAGARLVIASDQWTDITRFPAVARGSSQFRFRRAAISDIEFELRGTIDLAFANTVTEHLPDLPGSFASLFRVIKPGGYLFLNHDNYYQPVGSHDHGFLRYRGKEVVRQGPSCWEDGANCALSKSFRDDVAKSLPWTWDHRNEAQLTLPVCTDCAYYRRSQPWAHLLYQDSFATLFPQDSFSTGKPNSSLNKVTVFQLRQFLVEAGFEIEKEVRLLVDNQPPDSLLRGPHQFTELDLKTGMYRVLARRKVGPG